MQRVSLILKSFKDLGFPNISEQHHIARNSRQYGRESTFLISLRQHDSFIIILTFTLHF